MRECIPQVESNCEGTDAGQRELRSETLISAFCLRHQAGAEAISEQVSQKRRLKLPRLICTRLCSLTFCLQFVQQQTLGRRAERHQSSYIVHIFSPFGSYLLYFLLTLQFQLFNDTIVSENNTETDTFSHIIGYPDKMESAVF